MWTTFENVTISIQAKTPKQAYNILCELIGNTPGTDWHTDTYYTEDNSHEPRETHELFPLCESAANKEEN